MAARKARPAARLAAAFVAASLSACSVADQLAGHSLEYNIQAERVKNQNLLVNIVRAAYRRPLQFTDLTTITGQTGIQATGGLQLPFAGPMAADTTRLFVFNPSIQATNSPSYTVAVLNTKEFYQGILTPIPMQTIAYYIRTGFPKSVLLALAISEIEYGHAGHTKRVDNIPAKPEFSQLLGTLIAFGLNVEEADATTVVGDPFGDKDYPAPKVIADLDGQGIQVVRHGIDEPGSALTAAQKAQFRAAGHYFQLEKTSADSRFCFDPSYAAPNVVVAAGAQLGDTGEMISARELCGSATAPPAPAPGRRAAGIHQIGGAVAAQSAAGADASQVLSFRVRSTEGMIYYLGEISRYQLGLVPADGPLPDRPIFRIAEGPGDRNSIAAPYNGKTYRVIVDPSGKDRSSQVMELLTELLAQNNSAKDLPAPSVIPIAR